MDFALSDEQEALADAARSRLTKNDPLAARRPMIDDGIARVPADELAHAANSGLLSMLISEIGGSHVDLLVLVEEHGRAASALPLAEAAVACRVLELLDNDALDAAASGESVTLPVLASTESPSLTATIDGAVLRLRGTSAPITGLPDADCLLIVASTSIGTNVAAVVPVGAVVTRDLDTLDVTRAWSVVDVDLDLDDGDWSFAPAGTLDALRDEMALFRAGDALGGAARLLDMTVEYAGQRTQFDRVIGSFQAVKHHCADMALAVEASRAVLWAAAVALDGDDAAVRARAVAAAAAFVGDATRTAAQTALQVHGGIGFTWEHDVHLFIRRIKVDELLDGSVDHQRRRLVSA